METKYLTIGRFSEFVISDREFGMFLRPFGVFGDLVIAAREGSVFVGAPLTILICLPQWGYGMLTCPFGDWAIG